MGTISKVIEDGGNYRILQVGGTVHYSQEFRAYLSRIPREQADRVVAEIEYQARPRKVIEYFPVANRVGIFERQIKID